MWTEFGICKRPRARRSTKLRGDVVWRWRILLSGDGRLFGQLSPPGSGGGKSEPHVFSLAASKKQVAAHSPPQLGILPDGRHQACRGVRSRAEQKVSQFVSNHTSK